MVEMAMGQEGKRGYNHQQERCVDMQREEDRCLHVDDGNDVRTISFPFQRRSAYTTCLTGWSSLPSRIMAALIVVHLHLR
eukprot:m.273283 g.273283  ORF g.273283 m.273283 type:complete len:80 (+) comp93554_c0_seq1:164-403(+)